MSELRRVTCGCLYSDRGVLEIPCKLHGESPTAQEVDDRARASQSHGVPSGEPSDKETLVQVTEQRNQLWHILSALEELAQEHGTTDLAQMVSMQARKRWQIHNPEHTDLAVPVERPRSLTHGVPTPVAPSEPPVREDGLPVGHKRPSLDEWVDGGGKPEDYERKMREWEDRLRARGGVPFTTEPTRSHFP